MKKAVRNVVKSNVKWRNWVNEQIVLLDKALRQSSRSYPFGAGVFPDGNLEYLGYCCKLQRRNNETDRQFAKRVYVGLKHILGANGIERAIAVLRDIK